MEHQRCYIYDPDQADGRSAKRQRTAKLASQAQLPARLQTYHELWSLQNQRIQATLEESEKVTQENIATFIRRTTEGVRDDLAGIPSGLIVAGPSIASHGPFFDRLGRRIKNITDSAYLVLTSGESPNLKTLLKNLIKKATSRVDDDDEEDLGRPSVSSRNAPKLLDFDLGHLQEWRNRNRVQSVVVVLQDSEAFDSGVLEQLVELVYSWRDRLPFVLLFGIATSAESFEDRLSGRTTRYLEGQKFDVTQSDEIIEKLFSAIVASTNVPLRIGPGLSRRILERQKDHVQNVQDFSDGLKYGYMSHFYANCTSIFLKDGLSFEDVSPEIFEAVRNLPSFRIRVEMMLEKSETNEIRSLLTSDQDLFQDTTANVDQGKQILYALSSAAIVFARLRHSLHVSPNVPLSSIWIRAASGDMVGSPLLRETMLSVKKLPSDKLDQLLTAFHGLDVTYFPINLSAYHHELTDLLKKSSSSTPLRTQHDVRNESLRTTVVAQKVLLSKHKANLSEEDNAYSDLVARLHDELDEYFSTTFIDPRALYLSEVLIYDLKSPHTEVFQPKPRFAIERALASPHDYLGCECCGVDNERAEDASLASTQPATAILYQLYLESGAIINVSDLWSAFNTIAGDAEDENTESKTMALFQRSLAELKYLGLIKPTKKKADHIAKAMWRGL
ncbi:hypothetical protein P154DRAFT_443665 [Amniculicola lignicola CBS 123094]|uniref:Uncharacterized protein n=1 Tax=Amniculicola lignicola CBS 123094 TaxID=1392246 RepID=A0A6A5W816_9PLEO|nr:hypothetical protein P154DRAFT_443665 [Amniculicola lignicola CBS 123094]